MSLHRWHAFCSCDVRVCKYINVMDLILVADNLDNIQPVMMAAAAAGHRIVKQVGPNDEVSSYLSELSPEGMIVISDEMDRATLREMRAVVVKQPMPIVVLTRDSSETAIDAAVKAGASAYVVDCSDTSRIGSLLRVAQTRFREQQTLHKELEETKNALQARKLIDKAKGIIMKQKSLSEDEAYKAMRKLAMNHNRRIGDIAEQIIAASEVLL